MSVAHLLEEFAPQTDGASLNAVMVSHESTEALRLEAYEEGYKAGWEDAVHANQAENLQVSADLEQNLKDISVTFKEAGAHLTQSLQGVFDAMLAQFLPEVARAALAPKVVEHLEALSLGQGIQKLTLSVAPDNRDVLERLFESVADCDVTLLDDPLLSSGQVLIGYDNTETSIDFDAILEQAKATLLGFQKTLEKES